MKPFPYLVSSLAWCCILFTAVAVEANSGILLVGLLPLMCMSIGWLIYRSDHNNDADERSPIPSSSPTLIVHGEGEEK